MSEKEKPKRSPHMGFLRSCLIFSLYPLLILIIFGIAFLYWLIGGYVKPSLDPQYIPTAEYLLEYPFEEPQTENWQLGLNVWFDGQSSIEGRVCFNMTSMTDADFANLLWAEVYINEQFVSRFHEDWLGFIFLTMPAHSIICLDGHLDNGLHIIEFRLKEHLFAEPHYIQRWAIEIP